MKTNNKNKQINVDDVDITELHSCVRARLVGEKPQLSQSLPLQKERLAMLTKANPEVIGAPSAKLFRGTRANPTVVDRACNVINSFRTWLHEDERTKPWPEKGITIHRAVDMDDLLKEFDKSKRALDKHLRQIRDLYPSLESSAREALGDNWDQIKWPNCEDLLNQFIFTFECTGDAFSFGSNKVMEGMKSEIFNRCKAKAEEVAKKDLLKSTGREVAAVMKELGELSDQLKRAQFEDKARMRGERFEKLPELANKIRTANWGNVEGFDNIASDIEELATKVKGMPEKSPDERVIAREEIKEAHAKIKSVTKGLGI